MIAAITVLAVALACVFAAIFYTRTQDALTPEEVPSGESASGTSSAMVEYQNCASRNELPSGGKDNSDYWEINDESTFNAFFRTDPNESGYDPTAANAHYGVLTKSFTIDSKLVYDRILASGRTLNGNGHTITATHYSNGWDDDRQGDNASRQDYVNTWGVGVFRSTSTDGGANRSVSLSNGQTAFGISDVISINNGTIKNLNFTSNASQRVYLSPQYGNVAMGGIAGINFGTIENCTSTISGGKYGIVGSPWYKAGASMIWDGGIAYRFNGGTFSTQDLFPYVSSAQISTPFKVS